MKKKFLASLLAVAVVSTGALTMVACDGGSGKQVNNPSGVEAVHTDNGGVEITNQQNSGIRVMSTKLNKKQYAA